MIFKREILFSNKTIFAVFGIDLTLIIILENIGTNDPAWSVNSFIMVVCEEFFSHAFG